MAQSGDDAPQERPHRHDQRPERRAGAGDAEPRDLRATTEDDAPGAARTVGSFRGPVTDGDPGALTGIAITATAGNGDVGSTRSTTARPGTA